MDDWHDGRLINWFSTRTVRYRFQDHNLITPTWILCDWSKVTGIHIKTCPDSPYSKLVIEKRGGFGKPANYIRMEVLTSDLCMFTVDNPQMVSMKQQLGQGLPSWSWMIPFMTFTIRRSIQYCLILIELLIFTRSIYQLAKETPYVWDMLLFTPFRLLIGPLMEMIGRLQIIIQLRTIFWSLHAAIITISWIVSPLLNLINGIIYFVTLVVGPLVGWLRSLVTIRTTIQTGQNTGSILTRIWRFVIKPIRNVYLIIRAPFYGELGRQLNRSDRIVTNNESGRV